MKRSALPLVCGRYGRVRVRRTRQRSAAAKPPTDVAAAVVREHPRDRDAAASKPADGASKKARRGGAGLVRQDFDVGGAAVIIDRDVHVLPPGA